MRSIGKSTINCILKQRINKDLKVLHSFDAMGLLQQTFWNPDQVA